MTGNGRYLPLGEFRWAFDQATAAVGLAGVVPHGLRHSAASLAIKVVQRMLGHKTATLTLDLYGHLFDDDLGPVADAMNRGALAAADELRTKTADPAADDQRDTGSPVGS
ncbi:hypothetical protein [Nocardia brasiliensis]|uniref:hypothetical protein n=1 Tax=Nocardia brasiliensis TaxID=37326 RepID=UPI0032AF2994